MPAADPSPKATAIRARARRALAQFIGDRRAAVTVEFAMIMPFLTLMLFASVEGPSYMFARGAVVDAAGAVGDLASQSSAINETSAAAIFNAADRMIHPEGAQVTGLTATLTSALTCKCQGDSARFCFTVIWSHGYDNGALAPGLAQDAEVTDVPQDIALAENETVLIADVSYRYSPAFTHALKITAIDLKERMYFRPRRSREVTHLGAFASPSPALCPVE